VKTFKLISLLILSAGICVSTFPQNPNRGIRPEPPEAKGVVVLRAARLIDGAGAAPVSNAVVIVTDNRISAVGPASSIVIPVDAKVIDLGDVTLLPGFIDAHTHLVGRVLGDPDGDVAIVKDYESFAAILSVANAR